MSGFAAPVPGVARGRRSSGDAKGLLIMAGVRSIEAVAAGLTAAFPVEDLDQLAQLLAPDVRER